MKVNKLIVATGLSALLVVESTDSMRTPESDNPFLNKKLQQIEIDSDKYKEAVSEVAFYYRMYTDIFGKESDDLNSVENTERLKRIATFCGFIVLSSDRAEFIKDISKEIQRHDQLQTLGKSVHEKLRIAAKN